MSWSTIFRNTFVGAVFFILSPIVIFSLGLTIAVNINNSIADFVIFAICAILVFASWLYIFFDSIPQMLGYTNQRGKEISFVRWFSVILLIVVGIIFYRFSIFSEF